MGEAMEMFDWPDVRFVMSHREWLHNPRKYPQHRYWSAADGWLSCTQDYNPEDYDQVTRVAQVFGVMDRIADFKVNGNENGSERPEFSAFHPPIHLGKNDALVISKLKLDCLGRTVRGLVDLVGELGHRSLHFQSLTDGINTIKTRS